MSARMKALAIFASLVLSLGFSGARANRRPVGTATSAQLVFLVGAAVGSSRAQSSGAIGAAEGSLTELVGFVGGEFGWLSAATVTAFSGAALLAVGTAA